ncbi:hypothetical protein AB0I35_32015 [Nocardia sp. NPDC050378]|uniref:hypothetical protein n=1 Tax=Nocardia sp. NPDC050378 TaxID=3155400 RepID=UPI0033C1A39B
MAAYELLSWTHQEDLLTAAAVAMDLVAQRRLRPRGTLAAVLAPPHAELIYLSDDPRHPRQPRNALSDSRHPGLDRRADYRELFDELARSVRTDADTTRRLLAFLLATAPGPANLDRERDILIRDTGMPPDYVRTRAETEALLILHGHPSEIGRVLAEFAAEFAQRGVSGPAADLFGPEDFARLRARLDR